LTLDLFEAEHGATAAATAMPPGFRYLEDLITSEEEAALASEISQLELKPFEFHGYLGLRRVRSFGYRYDYARRKALAAEDIPEFLKSVRHKAAHFAGRDPDEFRQILVTEYAPGAPIGWHKDKSEFGVIVGVSLLSTCTLRLRKRRATSGWDRASVSLEPRSAYIISGESRSAWEHSIPPVQALRYSLTFRTLA
jgi:alkylated DNA repair dioxygenase AlkB